MKIGNIQLSAPLVMAPMAGITDLAFRKICREFGAGLVVTEMVSAKAISFGNEKTLGLLATEDAEKPVSVQIFGSDPAIMGQVAAGLNDSNFDIIDINMGCPAPKIVKNGDGSALMRDPALIGRILRTVIKAATKPVTCKIRLGYDHDSKNYLEVAKIAEDSGAAAITVHGRTRPQMYGGRADWDAIAEVKHTVGIPVIGNGDIASPEDARRRLDESGVDALMIGRAACGNPWLFQRCAHYLETGEILPEPTPEERIKLAMRHTGEMIAQKGEFTAVREMRKHIAWYIKGMRGATTARDAINKCQDFTTVEKILQELLIDKTGGSGV
ncbi:MAG: tRNA dihydrouridine synthase DusB [Clostridiales bacterium]|jgi:nifR3 family TIM-barrel protein|nr:tRNA dihydrouridine synthase DusB [Clostridiales bacterium]